MTMKKAWIVVTVLLVAHLVGLLFGLYGIWDWYDMPMHFGGGLAMGALGLAIWNEGIQDVRYKKGPLQNYLQAGLVSVIVLGFVALVSVLWELHEWLLDVFVAGVPTHQPSVSDTMVDFIFDLLGGLTALIVWRKK